MKVLHAFLYLGTWHVLSAGGAFSSNTSDTSRPEGMDVTKLDPHVNKACLEFNRKVRKKSGWLHSDCVAVWNGWAATLEKEQLLPCTYREGFLKISAELRRQGNPCFVESIRYPDGAGSSAVRYLATWIFAEEMGCDWLMPPPQSEDTVDGDGSSLYCHKTMARGIAHPLADQDPGDNRFWRCEVTNWLHFFHYNVQAVNSTLNGNIKGIQTAIRNDSIGLRQVVEEYHLYTGDHLPWDHLVLHLGKSSANRFFQLANSWDSVKRDVTRGVIQKYRERFHEFPRPWFNHLPKCMYSSAPDELNFAIHVRLGDRATFLNGFETGYVHHIATFIETVTAAVTRQGLDVPMFHIFSETLMPCPDVQSRTFPEFPNWPVEKYQIEPCLDPVTPVDCAEKRAGALSCNPERSGIFRVFGKPLYLHVGLDVQNDLTCMSQADGVLMGCSTFGQISGVLNKGLKFFSFECAGAKTPNHYKMMPPLAVAEQGNLWVPMAGSWHDPSILSEAIFEVALDNHLKNKRVSSNKE